MAETRVQRRLAAILAADVAGFSRLMGADEEGTLAALTAHLTELIEPCIAEHRGRVVKTAGDGLLAEFASVVDAVRCAVAFQDGMAARNADVSVERCIAFRIGINLGDVIVQDKDVFGDGVNVAARLEGLAAPGSIVVSGKVQDEVQDKVDISFTDLGPQKVKNIARPVPAFAAQSRSPVAQKDAVPHLPDTHSIAVLPFDNLSDDPGQDYFADGLAEDLITSLSKISGLSTVARNASFAYKNKSVAVPKIAAELGVRYVMEGSVRKAGNKVRITSQMIDSRTGGHLWAERYDREISDIFAVQDEVTQEIVSALALKLSADEWTTVRARQTENPEAYDCILRGREKHRAYTRDANAESQSPFQAGNRAGSQDRGCPYLPRPRACGGIRERMVCARRSPSGRRRETCGHGAGAR